MATLTIAIPSYNRNAVLAENLTLLLPQLTGDCVLTIIDNASNLPISETLSSLREFTKCPVNIIRNIVNIGGNANLLRCLETCATKWIWILGDDDPVKPDAVSKIMSHLEAYPDHLYINFRSGLSGHRDGIRAGRGIEEFAQSLDSFSNALFMSTCVFNATALMRYISFGYQYAYSYAPHLALALAAMGQDGKWCLSDSELVEVVTSKTVDQLWCPLMPNLGKMTLLELPMGDRARRLLARKIAMRPRPEILVFSLIYLAQRRGSNKEALFLYGQLCSRLYWGDRRVSSCLRRLAGGMLIRFWPVTTWVISAVRKRLTHPRWDHYKGMMDRAAQDQWHRLL